MRKLAVRLGLTLLLATIPAVTWGQLRIHVDELDTPVGASINFGWDRPATCSNNPALTCNPNDFDALTDCGDGGAICRIFVSTLTPSAPATIADLLAGTWNFSGNTTGGELASYTSTLTATETCNFGFCGYDFGLRMSREDKNFDLAQLCADPMNPGAPARFLINTLTEQEIRESPPGTPIDTTIWLRAGAINEGCDSSSLLARDGESRLCFKDESGTGGTFRSPVPLWRFDKLDAQGWYFDITTPRASSAVFQCEQAIFNQNCGVSPGFPQPDLIHLKACSDGPSIPRTGTQYVELVAEGPVTLPSGHVLDSLVLRVVADYCLYSTTDCGTGFLSKLDEVRTVTYLWQVPRLGTVVRLQSPQQSESPCAPAADPDTCFGELVETDIDFGLFPPLTVSVDATRDTEVDISWNPGNDTHRIDDYRIYWSTTSGSGASYLFDSVTNAGQVTFSAPGAAGTSATISGLTAGTDYFLTVTSRYTYTNPSTLLATTHESLLFPTQVTGPGVAYPVEVQATTTGGACTPTQEVANVSVTLDGGGQTVICWDASTDPCLEGYDILGADTMEVSGNFSTIGQNGLTTCFPSTPSETFFLVVTRGSGGTGPWGHYGM